MAIIIEDSAVVQPRRSRRFWIRFMSIILLALGVCVSGIVLWARTPIGVVLPDAQVALQSDDRVTILHTNRFQFFPGTIAPQLGLIIYPDRRIPSTAYAPLAKRIAQEGYLAIIIDPLLMLPAINTNAANAIIENFSAIEDWVIVGHGAGGQAALSYRARYPDRIDGVVVMGMPPSDRQLQGHPQPVMVIYGTQDQSRSTQENQTTSPSIQFIPIEGGNNAQFAYYMPDNKTSGRIDHTQQMQETARAILGFLERLGA